MRSLDTNVLARFFVDDPDDAQSVKQRPAAIEALSSKAYVSVTVLLELEWVMRGFYSVQRRDICQAFRSLAGVEHVTIEDRDAVLAALDAFEAGMDFADALHVSRNARAASFATFDRHLVRRARQLGLPSKVELLD